MRGVRRGRAVHVDPIRPTLTAPGTKGLKPIYDKPLSSFAFNFNLRRYSVDDDSGVLCDGCDAVFHTACVGLADVPEVERCMLNSIEAPVESACVQALKL